MHSMVYIVTVASLIGGSHLKLIFFLILNMTLKSHCLVLVPAEADFLITRVRSIGYS